MPCPTGKVSKGRGSGCVEYCYCTSASWALNLTGLAARVLVDRVPPRTQNFLVEMTIAIINARARLGSVSWADPATADIKASANTPAFALSAVSASCPLYATRVVTRSHQLDFGAWASADRSTLVTVGRQLEP